MDDFERRAFLALLSLAVLIIGYGIREWVQSLRQTVRDSQREREETTTALHALTLSLSRVTDALMGFNGSGGLIDRVAGLEVDVRGIRELSSDASRASFQIQERLRTIEHQLRTLEASP